MCSVAARLSAKIRPITSAYSSTAIRAPCKGSETILQAMPRLRRALAVYALARSPQCVHVVGGRRLELQPGTNCHAAEKARTGSRA